MTEYLEADLNDLIMKAERTTADFREEVARAKRIDAALARLRQLNGMAWHEARVMLDDMNRSPRDLGPLGPAEFVNRVALPN